MNLLKSLTISNSSAATASEHLKLIEAPHLSQLELSYITAKDTVADHIMLDDDDEAHDPDLDLAEYQDQITALTLTKIDREVYHCAFRLWKLSNLVFLTLHLDNPNVYSHDEDVRLLHNLVRATATTDCNIRCIDIHDRTAHIIVLRFA